MVDNLDTDDLFEVAIKSLKNDLKLEAEYTEHFYELIDAKYKESMINMYRHITIDSCGKLSIYVSPDSGSDCGALLNIEDALLEEVRGHVLGNEVSGAINFRDRLVELLGKVNQIINKEKQE